MTNYEEASYACHLVCEDKTRKFFYNEEGVYEGIWKGYDIINFDRVKLVIGLSIPTESVENMYELSRFLGSLRYGHDVFDGDKLFQTKGDLLFTKGISSAA